ncbi:MAG: hypothetical protein ACYC09_09825 [Bacteroidota bacterium]
MPSRSSILFLLVAIMYVSPAQDTVVVAPKESPVYLLHPTIPEFLREQAPRFASFRLDVVSSRTPGNLNRWGMYSPEFFEMTTTGKIDLTAPLKLQLMKQEKNKVMYSILGSVQLGGTAYLLYRHIKKNKGIK